MSFIRDAVVFFAGFEVFHTLSHIYLWWANMLPLATPMVELTTGLNFVAIALNGFVAFALLWYACKKKGACCKSKSE